MPKSEKVEFTGSLGDKLAARLDLPDEPPRAYVLFAHCFSCSKDVFAASRISRSLATLGLAVLRFDFTGLGRSDGDFSNTNFTSNVGDLVAAADFLRSNYEAPQLLVGHSLGGAAVLMAAPQIPEVAGIATIGAPASVEHVEQNISEYINEIEETGEAEVTLGNRPFVLRKQFLEDIRSQKVLDIVSKLRKPLIIFHAPLDDIVSIDNASEIFGAAKHPKSFVSLDTADHLLTKAQDAFYVGGLLSAWAGRFLGETLTPLTDDKVEQVAEGLVVVQETGEGKFANEIIAGKHVLQADEPEDFGGTNTGPSPYNYLSAALGACTAMTLRMYADQKGLKLDNVKVTLSHDKRHIEDCEDCKGKIDHIDRQIELRGDLSADQKSRLLEIADKCPVHKTLNAPVVINTQLVGGV